MKKISALVLSFSGLAAVVMGGCKDLTGTQSLPAGVTNPSYYSTPMGALGMRNAADSLFKMAFLSYIIDAGLLSDELEDKGAVLDIISLGSPSPVTSSLDERILLDGSSSDNSYNELNVVRGATNQAIGALSTYYPAASPALRGEMYAIQGYAELMLADLFCSGIPLSTLDFQGDFTYHAGSTKEQVYKDAIAKFDTALAISSDSVRIMNLARVGLGRANLALGNYTEAAQAVDSVPDDYQYQINMQWYDLLQNGNTGSNALNGLAEVSDAEGVNGLPFISSGDPRTTEINSEIVNFSGEILQLHFPQKYQTALTTSYSPTTVADWIEARLIRAEKALAVDHDPVAWLAQLNYLRQNARVSGQTGTLPQLSDPGVGTGGDTARVSLMFQERAYWLYMTGHRQGDLRRLIRQYNRDQSKVYPTGIYRAGGTGKYGTDVTVPIPLAEFPNPLFHGCIDSNA